MVLFFFLVHHKYDQRQHDLSMPGKCVSVWKKISEWIEPSDCKLHTLMHVLGVLGFVCFGLD